MEKLQKIGVSGFLLKDNKVLITKRSLKETFLPGIWELPGGKIEFGERIEEAIEREFKEETDLNVEAMKPVYIFSYLSDNGNRQTFAITYLLRLKDENANIVLSDAHTDYKWISGREIGDFNITEETKRAIRRGFEFI